MVLVARMSRSLLTTSGEGFQVASQHGTKHHKTRQIKVLNQVCSYNTTDTIMGAPSS